MFRVLQPVKYSLLDYFKTKNDAEIDHTLLFNFVSSCYYAQDVKCT